MAGPLMSRFGQPEGIIGASVAPAPAPRSAPAAAKAAHPKDAPVLLTTGYMGHMWELHTLWGWIGPFLLAPLSIVLLRRRQRRASAAALT